MSKYDCFFSLDAYLRSDTPPMNTHLHIDMVSGSSLEELVENMDKILELKLYTKEFVEYGIVLDWGGLQVRTDIFKDEEDLPDNEKTLLLMMLRKKKK